MARRDSYLRAGIIGALSLGLAVHAGREAFANAYARSFPESALRANSSNGRAVASKLDAHFIAGGESARFTAADREAIRAGLRSGALNAALVRLLAIDAELERDLQKARSLMGTADRISRRDPLSQMWLIEDAVRRDNVQQALAHYDIALSTSYDSRPLLFSVLSGALADAETRSGIARYIAARRPWRKQFLEYAANAAAPADVAALLLEAGVAGDAELRPTNSLLLNKFASAHDVPGAQRYALKLPGMDARQLTTYGFTAATTQPAFAPVTWRLMDSNGVNASLAADGQISVQVASGSEGLAAHRIVRLAPGRYLFSHKTSFTEPLPTAVRWEWQCLGAEVGPLWQQSVPLQERTTEHRWTVAVPAKCTGVWLQLIAVGTMDSGESSFTVEDLEIIPTRP